MKIHKTYNITVLSISSLEGIYPINGTSKFSGALMRQLDYADKIAKYIAISNDKLAGKDNVENLDVYSIGTTSKIKYLINGFRLIKQIIKKHKIDCITCSDPYLAGILGIHFGSKYKIPLEISVMSDLIDNSHFISENPVRNLLANFLAKCILKRADGIRVSTNFEVKKLEPQYGSKVYPIPFYVHHSMFNDSDEKRTIQSNFKILFVGRLEKQKRVDILLKSISLLKQKVQNFQVQIVGEGSLKNTLENLAKSLELGKYVKFEGKVEYDKVQAFYSEADLFLITSHHEGSCMVLHEAALNNLPIVSTKFAGAVDLLEDFEEGSTLCEINNPKEIAERIYEFMTNKELRGKATSYLKKTILKNYNGNCISQARARKWMKLAMKDTSLREKY